MRQSNIYSETSRQYDPSKMSSRQQTIYLKTKSQDVTYDPDKDLELAGKSRGSASDVDYQEAYDTAKALAVLILLKILLERERK